MMRRQLAHAIATSNPAAESLRPFLLALLALVAMPATAQACAMYLPDDVLVAEGPVQDLDEIFSLIDGEAETTPARREALAAIIVEQAPALSPKTNKPLPASSSQDATADADPQS